MNQSVVTPSHQLEGTYICTASNSQGKAVKTFKVTQNTSKLRNFILLPYMFKFSCLNSLVQIVTIIIINAMIPSCCRFPSGSLPGTTAAILVAVFFLLITIMACVVYRKQRNFSADRP